MELAIIFILCIAAFIWDRFPVASVSTAACIAMVVFGVCSPAEMMVGFTNDIVLIVFGTEIFGVAFQESGLSAKLSELIVRFSKSNEGSVILIAGLAAALLSAFLNTQVICALMLVICIHIAGTIEGIEAKNITLPVVYCAILGGQCTLIGAPATLIASSMAEDAIGSGISMFEILPMGLILLSAGLLWIVLPLNRKGSSFWCTSVPSSCDVNTDPITFSADRRKITVTAISGAVMLFLFVTGFVTVGVASVIGALICIFGGAVEQKKALGKNRLERSDLAGMQYQHGVGDERARAYPNHLRMADSAYASEYPPCDAACVFYAAGSCNQQFYCEYNHSYYHSSVCTEICGDVCAEYEIVFGCRYHGRRACHHDASFERFHRDDAARRIPLSRLCALWLRFTGASDGLDGAADRDIFPVT